MGWLPRIHYGLASVGTVVMVTGIAGIMLGHGATFEPLAIGGSVLVYASFILFVAIVFRATPFARRVNTSTEVGSAADEGGNRVGVWG